MKSFDFINQCEAKAIVCFLLIAKCTKQILRNNNKEKNKFHSMGTQSDPQKEKPVLLTKKNTKGFNEPM